MAFFIVAMHTFEELNPLVRPITVITLAMQAFSMNCNQNVSRKLIFSFFPSLVLWFIRSTKSEKMYPSMLSRAPDIETEPYYCLPVSTQGVVPWSQPTSPTPPTRGFTGLLSPTHNPSHRLTYPKKNDEGKVDDGVTQSWRHFANELQFYLSSVHGSQISLMSGGSSMYGSTTEEQRQANEVRRLKRELHDARDQVMSLSSQLSTNVSEFFSFFLFYKFVDQIQTCYIVFVMFLVVFEQLEDHKQTKLEPAGFRMKWLNFLLSGFQLANPLLSSCFCIQIAFASTKWWITSVELATCQLSFILSIVDFHKMRFFFRWML